MDDEVLGCGGSLARHAAAGATIEVVFLTDGRNGGGGLATDGVRRSAEEVTALRKAEARQAADILGIRTLEFLDAEDGRLAADPGVGQRLRVLLERTRPDIVYLPSFLEHHADHFAANAVLRAAVHGSTLEFECRGYEVWTPLAANCVVCIDQTMHLKERAMRCYPSQLAACDYLHSAIGLNAFRSMALNDSSARFAEAFHALSLPEYLREFAGMSA